MIIPLATNDQYIHTGRRRCTERDHMQENSLFRPNPPLLPLSVCKSCPEEMIHPTYIKTENERSNGCTSTSPYNYTEKAVPGTAPPGSQPSQPAATEVASQRHMTSRQGREGLGPYPHPLLIQKAFNSSSSCARPWAQTNAVINRENR